MKVPLWIATLGGPPALHALFATVRFREWGGSSAWRIRAAGTPLIFSLWHGHLLPLTYRYRRMKATALISEHRDGEYIARVVRGVGLHTARGSSTRGGSRGFRALVEAAKRGSDLAITPDGPRGPAQEAKEGVVAIAQATGGAIVPIAAACTRCWKIESWDTFLIPKPLSLVHAVVGEPLLVANDADARAALTAVQAAMDAATVLALAHAAGDIPEHGGGRSA